MTLTKAKAKQKKLLNFILKPNSNFEKTVLSRQEVMGADGAFFFTIGEMESLSNNHATDEMTDDGMEEFIDAIVENFPSLEY